MRVLKAALERHAFVAWQIIESRTDAANIFAFGSSAITLPVGFKVNGIQVTIDYSVHLVYWKYVFAKIGPQAANRNKA